MIFRLSLLTVWQCGVQTRVELWTSEFSAEWKDQSSPVKDRSGARGQDQARTCLSALVLVLPTLAVLENQPPHQHHHTVSTTTTTTHKYATFRQSKAQGEAEGGSGKGEQDPHGGGQVRHEGRPGNVSIDNINIIVSVSLPPLSPLPPACATILFLWGSLAELSPAHTFCFMLVRVEEREERWAVKKLW